MDQTDRKSATLKPFLLMVTWQVWTLAVPTAAYYEIKDSRSFDAAAVNRADTRRVPTLSR
jgi:hypothetical protein